MVPLRFIGESLGAEVGWDSEARTVTVNSGKEVSKTPETVPSKVCIDINVASIEELKTIVHIDEERAQQIIELRKTKHFESLDDLTKVKGIGKVRKNEIKSEGKACVH